MEDQDVEEVMSEVHVGCPPHLRGPHISHFTFPLPSSSSSSPSVTAGSYNDELQVGASLSPLLSLDDDGDLILSRRKNSSSRSPNCSVTIQHSLTSSLPSVGLQVWVAALVLADFVLHRSFHSSDFDGIMTLELGAGTGLVSIALAPFARTVFVTDRGSDILDNCATNAQLNSSLIKNRPTDIRVRELDWHEPWPPKVQTYDSPSVRPSYSWASSEIEEVEGASVLLAADVIYSDELTDSLFSILETLMSRGSKKRLDLILGVGKTVQFQLNDLNVVANGYAHFRSFLKDEEDCEKLEDSQLPRFIGERIDLSWIPQYIREYERGNNVELWKITYRSSRKSAGTEQ